MVSGLKRVVVTGMGMVTPLGRSVDENWERLLNGETSIRDVRDTHPYLEDYDVQIGSMFGEVRGKKIVGFEIDSEKVGISSKDARRMCENTAVAFEAAYEAIEDSGLDVEKVGRYTGVMVGAGFGGIKMIEENTEKRLAKGIERVNKLVAPMAIPGTAAVEIARHNKFRRVVGSGAYACASGLENPIDGLLRIVTGDAKVMVCGGTNEISPIIVAGFGNSRALMKNKDYAPECSSRPFDKGRGGFVLGDGAGILVLEELEHAKKRNARIYAEILGYSTTNDCFHATASNPNGEWAGEGMREALERAKLNPCDINYINAHGTGTKNDAVESQVIKNVFGDYTKSIPVNSIKSMLGHGLNGDGALKLIDTIKSMNEGWVHPTRNLDNVDFDGGCILEDYVKGCAKKHKIDYAMVNAFAFGGRNTFMVLGSREII
ncbi:beta-ketoacyl-[acyl-carrier-protein] synthase family protein [archaeon]|jgi:3-oxoacyl-[acyl-carrier-protein] synthase II|nr:beta-ketoacyl-[acyl-carrier-protein] synthase family protein [archaeon]